METAEKDTKPKKGHKTQQKQDQRDVKALRLADEQERRRRERDLGYDDEE